MKLIILASRSSETISASDKFPLAVGTCNVPVVGKFATSAAPMANARSRSKKDAHGKDTHRNGQFTFGKIIRNHGISRWRKGSLTDTYTHSGYKELRIRFYTSAKAVRTLQIAIPVIIIFRRFVRSANLPIMIPKTV